jgi:hypothetical protein
MTMTGIIAGRVDRDLSGAAEHQQEPGTGQPASKQISLQCVQVIHGQRRVCLFNKIKYF